MRRSTVVAPLAKVTVVVAPVASARAYVSPPTRSATARGPSGTISNQPGAPG